MIKLIRSNKDFWTQETIYFQSSIDFLINKILSEGDFLALWPISEISCKATKTLGFRRRNLALAPRHTKEVAYKTLVRPRLEYAAPIWHPYNETEKKRWRNCRGQQPGGPAGDGITRVALTICWTSSSGHLWRTAG